MPDTKTALAFELPSKYPREEVVKTSESVLGRSDIKVRQNEDVFRIQCMGMEWDLGVMIYEPEDPGKIPSGADGKKVGIFLLHGGAGDYKSMEGFALLFARKFGFKVVSMTFPGRLYLLDPSRDWPGDTVHPDGTVRTPMWKKDEQITPDQYEVGKDLSKRFRYGTRTVARAKPETLFYHRMAAWPPAFEEGMKEANRRHFPAAEYSIYVHGHSTGGPIVSMLCQRVSNIAGVIAIENSTFGYIEENRHAWSGALGKIPGYDRVTKKADPRQDPFNELYLRSWRDLARYRGPEALGQEGPSALMRLPWLMEEVLEAWEKAKARPQFKAEYIITHNIVPSLTEAARVTARRLRMNSEETEALVNRYLGYCWPLSGPGVKPVPPYLFALAKDSRDHSPEVYHEVVLPMFAAMNPAPRVHVVQFGAGVHTYTKPEKDLPMGIAPAAAQLYHDAIMNGYYL
jgi:hypothetical protein